MVSGRPILGARVQLGSLEAAGRVEVLPRRGDAAVGEGHMRHGVRLGVMNDADGDAGGLGSGAVFGEGFGGHTGHICEMGGSYSPRRRPKP